MHYNTVHWTFTLDEKKGFGIMYDSAENRTFRKCFFENGTLGKATGVDMDAPIRTLRGAARGTWNYRVMGSEKASLEQVMEKATCSFSSDSSERLNASLVMEKEEFQIRTFKERWYYNTTCSCGKPFCRHITVAASFLKRRIEALQHAYVVSEKEVDKSLFLEPALTSAMERMGNIEMSVPRIQDLQEVIRLVDSAKSDDYYWQFHEYLLDSSTGDYDAHYLDVYYRELLFALFEDQGYQEAVISTGEYAEPEDYEGRQHRSNRTCFKRILKEYQRTVRALDEKGDYSEDYSKEILLKYRSDLSGLLRYYAEGKEKLAEIDLPFLESITGITGINPDYVSSVIQKLDRNLGRRAEGVAQKLADRLSLSQKVEVYSGLHRLSMSSEEIRSLGLEEQRKMIWNTPLSRDNFCHIMDDLLSDSSDEDKGKYILYAADELRFSEDTSLKEAVIQQTVSLADNKLLLAVVTRKLGDKKKRKAKAKDGDPEKELKTYFSCGYEIGDGESTPCAKFFVKEPKSGDLLLDVKETNGKLKKGISYYDDLGYTPELIRKVCLEGREEKYKEAFEKKQDEMAAALFEKENRQFARDYRQFCTALSDEKILYTEEGKVGIEWQFFREDESNALAFRVGRSKKYVVKDALEFINAFKSGTTMEYGRDLILTHDPDNLDDKDASVIKQMITAKIFRGRKSEPSNKRYITFNDALLGNMLETMVGRSVLFNNLPCLIRMEPQKIKLKISSNYALSADIHEPEQIYLNLLGKGYLVTYKEEDDTQYLDRVDGPAEEINLISLIHENPEVNIQPILKDFRKNIYSRFFELFDVDKSVQRNFTLSQIRLNTYFDFEKGIITARTDVVRDGKEIKPDSLTDRIDRMKLELLETYLQNLGFVDGKLTEESRVLAFFKMDFTRLKTLTNVYLSDQLKNKELRTIGKPVIRVTYENNLVRVFLEKSEFSEAELEQIIAGLRKKRKYILLDGERIVDLDSEAARDFGETVKDFEMDPGDLYRKKTISMINAIKAFSHERSCRVDKYLRDMIEEIRSFKESEIPVPRLKAELRDYQTEGFRWLSILTKYGMGGILADDMGLGKTIQMIALIKNDRSRKPSLVICPKSLIFNWISEYARFDGTTRVEAIYGTDSKRSELIAAITGKEKVVYVTSYDSLRNDISKYNVEFNYVILDEAQYIKNVNALKTKSVKELKASHRFALTGTPIENSVVDLWSIFDFIMPGYFEELSRFRDTEPAQIARKAAPFILRRVKEDVLEDLPAKYERILSADMSEGQRKLYDAMRQEARKALENGGKAFDLLPYLTRLRQVCVDPGMFVENYRGGSGKMDMLSTLIPEYLEAHHRILIFSQFVKALESVQDMLTKKGIPTYFLSGATSARDRVEMMDSFNNGSGTDVFLISLKAGGTGLNLIGADTVIHLDPWWNVAAENQASDRTHRIGQTRNVEVIKLIAGESIEQRVVELQDIKKEVIRQVISDDDGSVTSASLEDIAFVLD